MRGLIFGLIIVFGIIFGLIYFFQREDTYAEPYKSQYDCEMATRKSCVHVACLFLCEDNKYGYSNGYVPKE